MHFFESSESVTQKSHHLDPIYMKSPFKFFKLMTGLLLPYFSLPKTDYSLDVLWQIFSIATLFKRIPMPLMIYPFNWDKYPGINILQINIPKTSRFVLVSPAIWTFENWSEKKSLPTCVHIIALLLESEYVLVVPGTGVVELYPWCFWRWDEKTSPTPRFSYLTP